MKSLGEGQSGPGEASVDEAGTMPCQMVWMRCSGVVKAVWDSQQHGR